jgi:hypothetical protein
MVVATGWWPPNVEFDEYDLATVVNVINEQAKQQERASRGR